VSRSFITRGVGAAASPAHKLWSSGNGGRFYVGGSNGRAKRGGAAGIRPKRASHAAAVVSAATAASPGVIARGATIITPPPPDPAMRPAGPNLEALRLYRDILRTAKYFYWPNDDGLPWCNVLRDSARKEFEEARDERDPLIVARLLVVGRQCVLDTQVKFNQMEEQMKKHVDRTRKR